MLQTNNLTTLAIYQTIQPMKTKEKIKCNDLNYFQN